MIPSEIKDDNNPYMDKSLMQNLSTFTPQANEQFVSKHAVTSKNKFESDEKEPKQPAVPFVFPSKLSFPPESIEFSQTYNKDNMDLKIEQYLLSKYKSEISSFKVWYDDIIIRFVTGYRHIAKSPNDYNKRLLETDRLFKEYIKWHKNSDMDNAINIKQINNIHINEYMSGSYVYGQNKYGHPLYWDEGLKLQKKSDLTIHKECGEKGMNDVLAACISLLHEMKYATNKYYGLPTGLVENIINDCSELKEKEINSSGSDGRIIGIFRHCIIFDLNNFNSKRVLKDRKIHEYYTKKASLISPEMIHKVYVINAPWVFQKIWKILKAFLHPNTIEKTQILGKDYMDELLKEIDINMIPVKFGGKGKWKANVAGIPKDYPIQLNLKK